MKIVNQGTTNPKLEGYCKCCSTQIECWQSETYLEQGWVFTYRYVICPVCKNNLYVDKPGEGVNFDMTVM
jgi:hypothetical protein